MKFSASLICVTALSLFANRAGASVTCNVNSIAYHQEMPCSMCQIPSGTKGSVELTCGGFKVSIDFDLYSRPRTLSLAIVAPNGATTATSSKKELRLVDDSGNGASVSCVAH